MTIMQRVKSSNLHAVGYDAETRTLIVEFLGGATWTYDDVPADTHAALMAAESIGRYFQANIRTAFQATKLPPPPYHQGRHNVLAAG